jgi:DHA1 family bicyclomycin/chloramphenicol resistance-like MFS transporter
VTSEAGRAAHRAQPGQVPVTALLIGTIAIQTAVPPFATDMYTPAFPRVTADLATSASLVGLTLTAFFIGLALGQLVGGPWSDQRGRRLPLLIGGVVCTIGAVGCALAPGIGWLVAARVVQGFGGGVAAAVARAVIVDVAHGDLLAKVMSILQALGGLAPMVAPVAGALVITSSSWRMIFWWLVGFGALMVVTAAWFVPETLHEELRHSGGLRATVSAFGELVSIRPFVGYLLTSTFSAFTMMAYIANSSYVLQVMKGMAPLPFSVFFASTALTQVLLSILNARLIGRVRPQTMITIGLSASSIAVVALILGVLVWDTPLVLTCAGFLVLMAAQAFIFGNAGALAAMKARHIAGAAAALQGVATAIAMAVSAPLASAGGGESAVPMIAVMAVGATLAVGSLSFARRAERRPS